MRVLALSVAVLLSLRICESSDAPSQAKPEASPQPIVSTSAAVKGKAKATAQARLSPRIGGRIVVVGDHAAELLIHQSGQVQALVMSLEGKLLGKPEKVKLTVVAQGEGKARHAIKMGWSGARACFTGKAQAELGPGPIEVSLEVQGKNAQATVTDIALVFEPVIGGSVMVAGNQSVELAAGVDGEIEAVVRDAVGAELNASAGATVAANLTAAGATPTVDLAWDAPRATFVGRVEAGVELVPGPVEVTVKLGSDVAVGGLAKLALRAQAAHGGRVAVVGNYSVELVANAGVIQAFVFDAKGKALAEGDLELSLDIDGVGQLELEWEAPSLSYRAKANTKIDLTVKPIRIELVAGGRFHTGAIAALSADARIAAKAGLGTQADIGANAQAGLGAKAGAGTKAGLDASAKAGLGAKAGAGAKASLHVSKPKISTKVTAPSIKVGAGTRKGAGAKASGKAGFKLGK